MKSDRALFQILHKQTLSTSGATKGRSMTEEVLTTAYRRRTNFEGSQTGIFSV
jgi:hypothetical protein